MTWDQAAKIGTVFASIAQVLLVGGLYITWRQLKTTLNDVRLRSRREAGVFAVAQAENFAQKIIPEFNKIWEYVRPHLGNGLPLERFTMSEVPKDYGTKVEALWRSLNKEQQGEINQFVNKIESIAISFMQGLADESIVFGSLAQGYCLMVNVLSFYYCLSRTDISPNLYQNTINLYLMWRNRLNKSDLEDRIRELEAHISATARDHQLLSAKVQTITPIGSDV